MKKDGLIILICLALVFTLSTKSYSDTEAGQVLTVKGNVYLIRDTQRNNAAPQMLLLPQDAVETDKKSRTKLFFTDDSILNLGELSRVEVEEYLYGPDKKRSKSIYRLIDGSLKMTVGRSNLEIHTPTAVASARGTKFIVWVEGSGDDMYTGVITLESEVVVKNIIEGIAKEVTVKSGQMSRVYMRKPPEVAQAIDMEIMRQFSNNAVVMGKILEDRSRLPDRTARIPESLRIKMKDIEHPPVSLEPEEALNTLKRKRYRRGMQ